MVVETGSLAMDDDVAYCSRKGLRTCQHRMGVSLWRRLRYYSLPVERSGRAGRVAQAESWEYSSRGEVEGREDGSQVGAVDGSWASTTAVGPESRMGATSLAEQGRV